MSVLKTIKFLSLKPQHTLIKQEIEEAMRAVFDSSQYILGSQVSTFEEQFAAYCESTFCVGVASGLDALTISLKALQVTASDEIIVPANTYFASWLAATNVGCRIVPVEPDEFTFTINPGEVENALTKRTRIILPVHLYGQSCDMTTLTRIAVENKLEIIEDNAQSHGATWRGKPTGGWGKINATSFYPTKNLGALGDGGAVTTSDPALAEFARAFRNYGSATKNYFEMSGINSRLDTLQAAILSVKLKYIDSWNEQRRMLAKKYNEQLAGVHDVEIPFVAEGATPVYHLYVIKAKDRDRLKIYLAENGIETMIHYPVPPYAQRAYKHLGFQPGSFPVTQRLADTVLSLPLWPGMHEDDIDYTAEIIKRFYS